MKDPKYIRILRFIIPVLLLTILSMTSAFGSTDEPGEEYLAQTMECEWATIEDPENPEQEINDPEDDLVALAASLDNDPVKIYNWVYKNIYSPQFIYDNLKNESLYFYYKDSRLGARAAYMNRRGNSWDQSSLLIALLRISKIPARYVELSALNIVYVEAWLDQGSYNGETGGPDKGWVPLVPWLKKTALEEGVDLYPTDGSEDDPVPSGLNFDFPGYLSDIKYQSALELYESQMQAYLNVNYSDTSIKDIPFKETIINNTGSVLPRSLPLNLYSCSKTRFAEVPDENRRNIHLYIKKDDGTVLLDYVLYMPRVAGKRFSLDWIYSDTSFTPVFKIDGEIVLPSDLSITPDDEFYLQYKISGTSTTVTRPNRPAGTFIEMGFDPLCANLAVIEKAKKKLQTVDAGRVLDPSTQEEYLGLMGQVLAETFLNRLYENSNRAAGLFYGIMSWNLSPTFIYTQPNSDENPILTDAESKFYYHPQWNIDAQSTGSLIKRDKTSKEIMALAWDAPINQICRWLYGYGASYDEGRIFEDWMDTLGASTIKGLMVANEDLENTGNKMVELVESDIIEETASQVSDFENVTVLPGSNDLVSYYEAYDGFHFYSFWRTPEAWSPQSGLALVDDAVDGSYGIRAWGSQATIARGTKFDFNSVKLSAVLDGAKYNFKGYRGSSSSPSYNVTYTINKTPQTITPGWTSLNKIVITQVAPTTKGPVVLENLNFTRKEYISDLDNQTENHLGYSSVLSVVTQLREGSRVITPVQQVNYAGLSGDIRIVHYSGRDLYSFGMDNGGGSDTVTQDDNSIVSSDSYAIDTGSSSSIYVESWQDENTISVNDTSTTYTVLADAVNSAVSAAGDPVNMAKGELYIQENPDFKIKGPGFDLSVFRQYRSQLVYNGPFGYGWTWNHAERIMPLTNDGALYYNNDGDSFEITKEGGAYAYPNGSTFTLEKNNDGFIVTHHKNLNKSYFSTEGCLTKKEDPFGNTLVYEYANTDYPNRITKITDRLGRSLTFEYNAAGKVVKITDFSGRYCSYTYTGDDLTAFEDLGGSTTSFAYLSGQENEYLDHNMTKYTLPGGDYLEIGYYKNDQVAYHTNAKGETFNFMYSHLNRYAETWNEEGYYRKLFFNERNDVVRISTEDKTMETMDYDIHHNKISHTDGNGYTTTFQYYPGGTPEADREAFVKQRNLYLKTDALGRTLTYRYDDTNNPYAPSQVTDPAGNITRFEYNTDGSLYKKIQAPGYAFDEDGDLVVAEGTTGFETVYEYDAYGNITKITDPLSQYEERTYDTNSLYLVTQKDKLGNETQYQYYEDFTENMPIGAVKSVTVKSGTSEYTTTYEYDQLGRKTKETAPLNQMTEYRYTLDGKLEQIIQPNGAVTRHIYDTARDIVFGAQIIETLDPLGNSVHFSYDATGKLVKKQDKNGNTFTFAYDEMGRLAKEIDPFRTVRSYAYDGNGNKTSIKLYDQAGVLLKETQFTYNSANQLVEKTIPCGFKEDGCEKTVQYQYTLDGKPQSQTIIFPEGDDLVTFYEYNALGKLIQETKGYGADDARVTQYKYDALGRLTQTIFALGNSEIREYDANGNVTAVKRYDQSGTLMEETGHTYDDRNLLVETVDPLENSTYYTYDALGRKTEQWQFLTESGDMVRYQWQYDSVGNVIQETDPLGRLTRHGYDLNNQQTKTVDALGQTTAFEYDPNSNLVAVTYPDLSRTVTYYDALNRKIGVEDELGYIQTFDYDEDANLVVHLDARKGITTFEYDTANRLRRKTNALGYTEETEYDPADRVIQKTDPRGIAALFAYDAAGNLTSQTLASGTDDQTVTRFEYDLNDRKTREIYETTQGDQITAFEYDDRGLLTHRKNGFHTGTPETWEYEYNEAGQLVATTDPNGNTTQVFYDAVGRKKAQTQAQGLVNYYWEYDLAGNTTLERKPEGEEIQNAYDGLNRLVLETRGTDRRRFEYDGRDRLVREENFNGDATQYQYDSAGRMIQKTETAGTVDETVSTYEYDENDNLVSITNPLLKTVSFEYDALNQRIAEIDSDGDLKTTTYDENSNVLAIEKRDGADIAFVWDNLNRKIEVIAAGTTQQTFGYDELSRLVTATDGTHTTTFAYNDYGRLVTEIQGAYEVAKLYDANGNKTQVTYPSGRVVDKTYNENDALAQILYQGSSIADFNHDRNNRLTSVSYGNRTGLALAYDEREREVSRTYTGSLFSQATEYDAQGNILEETLGLNGTSHEKVYTYDHLNRLVDDTASTTWDYDGVGNWLTTNQNGVAETRISNNDNEYTSVDGIAYTYDNNGNLTSDGAKDYSYDWADRLVQVEESGQVLAEYTYDALNRRVTKTVDSSVTIFVYDESDVIEEYTDGVFSRAFVYSSAIDEPVLLETGSQFFYYIAGRQGSVRAIVNDTGALVEFYEYSPFGLMAIYDSHEQDITATGSSIGNPFGYTARRWDIESGLWHYRNRTYSAELGRFLQRDPAGYVDGLNLYVFVLNNPLRYTDPSGLTSKTTNDFSYTSPIINLADDYKQQQQDWETSQIIGVYIQNEQEKIFVSTALDVMPGVGDAKGIGDGLYNVYENPTSTSSWKSLGVGIATVIPVTDLIKLSKVADKLSEVSKTAKHLMEMAPNNPVKWVDENAHMSNRAKLYNDSATGARSNIATQKGQAPQITRTLDDDTARGVRFDGLDSDVLIDRKISVVTTPKAKNQALRQSQALRQNNLTGRWEVPTQSQANRATKMFNELGIDNIRVEVVK
nr:RHS repeat-associated core domain-containing protein [uncultured Desulfobacter sp.]